MSRSNNLLDAALAHAARGWAVFPCSAKDKSPLTDHGFKDATTDEATIKAWWKKYPTAMIGVATGAASGIFAVDQDRKPGGSDGVATWDAWQKTHQRDPGYTRVHTTPSSGRHTLYRWRDNIRNIPLDVLGPGIELKGEGGYIIVPPSRMEDGREYKIVTELKDVLDPPPWLLDAIRAYYDRRAGATKLDPPTDQEPDIELIKAALNVIPSEDYTTWIAVGGALYRALKENGYALFEEWSKKSNKFNQGVKCRDKWTNGITSLTEFGLGTIFWYADKAKPEWRGVVLESASASSYKMKSVHWVWPNRFALGKIGLIAGLPDLAKSLLLAYIIACVTMGGRWPCNEGPAIRGRVLLLTAEDDIEDTVLPRLVAVGANLDLVEIVKMVNDNKSGRRMFNMATDLAVLRRKLEQFNDVVMVVVDPMSAYLGVGKVDSYRATDVRGMLAPLKELAEAKRISVLGLLHFNKKADVTNAMLRISDSLAFVAAARHCFACIDDPENKRRLFVRVKNNLAPDITSLSYTTEVVTTGQDEETGELIAAPRIVWGGEHIEITATEAMEAEANANKQGRSPEARRKARIFLGEILADGPVPATTVEETARKNDISLRTLKRAKDDLHIVSKWDREQKHWVWQLADQQQPTDEVF